MVAISLYRGCLHRDSGVPPPRRWVMPRPQISVKDLRGLLRRRSKALSLLKGGIQPSTPPNQHPTPDRQIEEEDIKSGVSQGNVNPENSKVIHQVANFVSLVKVDEKEIKIEDTDSSDNNSIERRKEEIEEKLEILKRRKHNLVLALKHVLNVEEELKTTCSMSNDSPSITRVANGF